MLIVMKSDATESQVEAVLRVIEHLGFKGHPMPGATRTAIGIAIGLATVLVVCVVLFFLLVSALSHNFR